MFAERREGGFAIRTHEEGVANTDLWRNIRGRTKLNIIREVSTYIYIYITKPFDF
jgi:hypothetical protein